MRSLRVITILAVAALAAAPLFAQSFTEEFEDITTLAGDGWYTQNNSTGIGSTNWGPISPPMDMRDGGDPDFQGNTAVFPALSGAGYIADNYNATTGASTISDWLMTPVVTISDGDTFSFYTRGPDSSNFPDRLEVRMSLAGTSTDCGTLPEDVGDFTTLLLEINPTLVVGGYPNTWTQYTIVVSGVGAPTQGRFALRYYVTNGGPSGSASDYIGVDLLEYTVVDIPAPPNDLCADAIPIDCDSAVGGTNTDATIDDAFPFCGTGITSPGVWYSIMGTGGDITVDTCTGTSFDTKISVYTDGCDPVATTCVDGNDDFCGLQSSVTWTSSPGVEYLVLVHSYGGQTGDFTLTTTCASAGPSIALTKTVGTVPAVCAATDNITVASGTPVYYCYDVENTGDVTFEFHTLDDDQLGQIFVNTPYTLNPGDTFQAIVETTVSGSSVTNTGTWTAKDSVGGFTVDDTIQVDFVDISSTGTALTLGDDDIQQVPIGFSFSFYGVAYTDFWVSSNGFLADNNASNGCCTGGALPSPTTPNGVIAGWWEDLDPPEGGGVYYETLGTAPNQVFIVQFTDILHFPGNDPVTLQYKLFEGTDVIEVHYLAAPSDGGTHSAGIENQDGTIGIQYYLGTAALMTPLAVQYAPTATQEAMASDTATVNISDPDITVAPMSLLSAQLPGEVNVLPLDIGNVGTEPLDWNIVEAAARSIPASDGTFVRGVDPPSFAAAPVGHKPTPGASGVPFETLLPGTLAYSTEESLQNQVYFDTDTPGTLVNIAPVNTAVWAGDFVGGDATVTYQIKDTNELVTVDTTTGAETVIGTLATPPAGETYTGMAFDPSTGNTYASSCNITTSSLFQIDVATATATLIGAITNSPCSIAIAATTAGDLYSYDLVNDVLLSVDKATGAGTTIGSIGFDANFGQGMDYDPTTGTMYMAAFNNGTFLAELRTVDLATGNTALVGTLGAGAGEQLGWIGFPDSLCFDPSDVPWLSVAPDNGTIAPAGSTQVDVTFDSTGLSTGIYEAVVCVFSNDPDESVVPVPATLEVLIPVELMSIDIE